MSRYQNIQSFFATPTLPRRYVNVKYPEISKEFNDSSLWWIISTANQDSSYDSLIPPIGIQIRIPNFSRVGQIQTEFENLNTLSII